MGRIEKKGKQVVYRQDDGEITAWLTDFEEKMEIGHEGTPAYRRVFYVVFFIATLYLGTILLRYIL